MKTTFKNYISSLLIVILSPVFLTSCSGDDNNNDDGKTLVVNNSKFGIYSNKTNAEKTTKGINAAIEYAKDNGYTTVKLTHGQYLIKCEGGYGYESNKGIFMPNNLTLDLTDGVKLYVEKNSVMHKLIWIDEVENVTILGGHLIGDKDAHTLNSATASGGNAIEINNSRNITIKNVKMEKFTGSAMWIGYGYIAPNERRLNKNIKIVGCDISDSWMQGISIVHASGVEIADNKIYGIGGIEPGCGIDIEPEADWTGSHPWKSWVKDVNIHHNEFKDTKAEGVCVVNYYSTDIEIADNLFDNSAIIINRDPKRIRLVRNTIKGWESYMVARSSEDVYMPLTGSNKNNVEFKERVANCSKMTGFITEADNYTKCD